MDTRVDVIKLYIKKSYCFNFNDNILSGLQEELYDF
jgi:hypothetical protein